MTKAEERENALIVSIGCMVCGSPPLLHHNRRNGGKRELAPKVPICHDHHSADSLTGLHHVGIKAFEREHGSVNNMAARVERILELNGLVPTWKK